MSYNGPGNIGELSGTLLTHWQTAVSSMLKNGTKRAYDEANIVPGASPVFFYDAVKDSSEDESAADIAWTAFPKRLSTNFPVKEEGWRIGDGFREAQEEYCEWSVVRDTLNPREPVKMVFTTETPDYFDFLFRNDPDLLLDIYRTYVSPMVELAELAVGGGYSDFNKWNHPGETGSGSTIMHMGGNRANTLGAAIDLSAQATWPSVGENGKLITSEQALIACRRFGDPARHSDPFIGAQVNQLVRLGNTISMAAPVGLYIDEFDDQELELPDGIELADVMTIERGDADHMMRLAFQMPPGIKMKLSDILVSGEPLIYGSQLAELMRIRIRGLAKPANEEPPKIPCDGAPKANLPMSLNRHPSKLFV